VKVVRSCGLSGFTRASGVVEMWGRELGRRPGGPPELSQSGGSRHGWDVGKKRPPGSTHSLAARLFGSVTRRSEARQLLFTLT